MKKNITLIAVLILVSCGIPEKDFEKLKSEKLDLEKLLDECKNGAEKIEAKIYKFYKEKNYNETKRNIELLINKHPESNKIEEFNKIYASILKLEEKIKASKLKAVKDSIRLANLNNTGMWYVGYFVDDFGEPTKKSFIGTNDYISGLFSNTATQDSKLNVRLLISSSSKISILLYEYAGNNPVKGYSNKKYKILAQDKEGKRETAYGENYSDRVTLDSSSSRKIHKMLLKGGTIKFKIYESRNTTTEYEFTIYNADYYNNAYRILTSR